jgi:putative transposase
VARKPRVHFPGAVYHVICRGNNRESVFDRETDKRSYMALVRDYKEKYAFKLYAWCLLSNHAHMLIEVGDTPLSKIMQGIQQTYTGRYNHFNKRTGHVFEQRYRAFLCRADDQLLATIHYIHHNPARAGLPGGINNAFCSHQAYIRGSGDSLTDIEVPLSIFAADQQAALSRYREFMIPAEFRADRLYTTLSNERVYQRGREDCERTWVTVPLSELAGVCSEAYGLTVADLTRGGRHSALAQARRVLVQFCLRHSRISCKELALFLGISQAAVSQAASYVSHEVSLGVEELSAHLIMRPDPN